MRASREPLVTVQLLLWPIFFGISSPRYVAIFKQDPCRAPVQSFRDRTPVQTVSAVMLTSY
eukprot:4080584-Prymnesium_polylepis.1